MRNGESNRYYQTKSYSTFMFVTWLPCISTFIYGLINDTVNSVHYIALKVWWINLKGYKRGLDLNCSIIRAPIRRDWGKQRGISSYTPYSNIYVLNIQSEGLYLWDITPCILLKAKRHFGKTCRHKPKKNILSLFRLGATIYTVLSFNSFTTCFGPTWPSSGDDYFTTLSHVMFI
jgi:hypothetical protein